MNHVYQTQKFEYSQYPRHSTRPNIQASVSSIDRSSKPHFPFARPRTRGRAKEHSENRRPTEENLFNAAAHHIYHSESNTEDVSQRFSNHNLDPNIAYFPQPRRKNKTNDDFDKDNTHSVQHIAAAKQKVSNSTKNNTTFSTAQQISNNKPIAVIEETIRLPR